MLGTAHHLLPTISPSSPSRTSTFYVRHFSVKTYGTKFHRQTQLHAYFVSQQRLLFIGHLCCHQVLRDNDLQRMPVAVHHPVGSMQIHHFVTPPLGTQTQPPDAACHLKKSFYYCHNYLEVD